jgi:hypothetical protein
MNHLRILAGLFGLTSVALAGVPDLKVQAPMEPVDKWELRLSLPGWLAGVDGDTGINGNIVGVGLNVGDIIPKIDMAASFRAELRKGRFGVYGDFLYLSMSDGVGSDRLVKKIDFRQDEYLGDLGLSWRVLEGERGYLEVIGGVRYTNLFTQLGLQGNDERIEAVSERLARVGTVSRVVLARELAELSGRDPKLPTPPLASGEGERLAAVVNRVRANEAGRQERIERELRRGLNRRFVESNDWFDPYIGLRGRYNFSPRVYFTGRADIGGFSIGADLSWQTSAGIGYQLSERKFLELSYRALGVDYDRDGFVYDVITHGAEVSLGMIF